MDFNDFQERVQAERSVRAQRDAAESRIPGERLRREIREAFARERQRDVNDDPEANVDRGGESGDAGRR